MTVGSTLRGEEREDGILEEREDGIPITLARGCEAFGPRIRVFSCIDLLLRFNYVVLTKANFSLM